MNNPQTLAKLVEERRGQLGLTAPDLIRRAGYQNTAKGLRRLQALMKGNFESSRGLIARLPEALNLAPETITQAIEETRRQIREEEEGAYRASFKPARTGFMTEPSPSVAVCAFSSPSVRRMHSRSS